MAHRLGKRKQPSREDKPINARSKITAHVFDDKTLDVFHYLLNNKVITSLDYPISEGKEAAVYKASSPHGDVAVKIFKYETSSFLKGSMLKYIKGDPRFPSLNLSHRQLVKLWARKEFSNLLAAENAGVSAPRPVKCRENVIIMQFLGNENGPYALLKNSYVENYEKIYKKIVNDMEKLWRYGFVHADLNEFNILTNCADVWIIDFAQAVKKEHPLAMQFLEKDCENIAKYFAKKGIKTSGEEILCLVTG